MKLGQRVVFENSRLRKSCRSCTEQMGLIKRGEEVGDSREIRSLRGLNKVGETDVL
jgi:hypothetical protein